MTSSIGIRYSKGHLCYLLGIFALFSYTTISGAHIRGINGLSISTGILLVTVCLVPIIRFGLPAIRGMSAIKLTPTGIIDNVRRRTIYWSDIESIGSATNMWSKPVVVKLKDPAKYKPSIFIGYIPYWLSNITFGSPVIIATNFADISASDLILKISAYRERLGEETDGQR